MKLKRTRISREAALAEREARDAEFIANGPLVPFVKRAEAAGCSVTYVRKRTDDPGSVFHKYLLMVNGQLCAAYSRSRVVPTPALKQPFALISVQYKMPMMAHLVIARTHVAGYPELFYVIPSERLLESSVRGRDVKRPKSLFLPLDLSVPPRGILWRDINYREFVDAWHLLRPAT